MSKIFLLFLILSYSLHIRADENYYYKTQAGDSITVILYSLGIFPAWKELPHVLTLNNINVQNNPDFIVVDQILYLPKPNPAFAANYKILSDNEIIILSKIKTVQQKEEFLAKRGLVENIPEKEDQDAVISLKKEEEELPRQVERFYLNYGLLFHSSSSKQTLSNNSSVTGTNSVESLNVGFSFEAAIRLKHQIYFDYQKFTLPKADSSKFSQDQFNLVNFSYNYGINFSKRFRFLLGLNYKEKIYYTNIQQEEITVSKSQTIVPSIGGMYFSSQHVFNVIPMFMFNADFFSKREVDNVTISNSIEYNALAGGFYDLDNTSHLELSLGMSYHNYSIGSNKSTDIGAKVILKYGREFFY